jgi:hypothetical protein
MAKGVSYRTPNSKGGCAFSSTQFHEFCGCSENGSFCKSQCSVDTKCKGYALTSRKWCQFATTSTCPPQCNKYGIGNVGPLLPDEPYVSMVYNGCYIKQDA